MKRLNEKHIIRVLIALILIFQCAAGIADDTCVFMVTADDVPPNIIILLDNGAAMEQIIWHSSYDNSENYTPAVVTQSDVVENGIATGNGFFNDNGYSIYLTGNKYYLVNIPANLKVAQYTHSLKADDNGALPVWTINNRTITLPATPSTVVVDEVIDNSEYFRYSKNYLNWIFYSGLYAGDGLDLPEKSRFYYAKKAIMTVAKITANQARFGVNNFTANAEGASNVQPLQMVVNTPLAENPENNTLESSFVNTLNTMGTVEYSPLAEGLASIGGLYASKSTSQEVVDVYCQKNFALVVSPGLSSEDLAIANPSQASPESLLNYDNDGAEDGSEEATIQEDENSHTIPVNQNGSTYLDDVAYYLYDNDIVGYRDGHQNVVTYTVGFMGDHLNSLFLINTSNNGNGNVNLYDTSDEEYGKYHFEAQNPDALAPALQAAVNDILAATSSFTAPVVPVTRTTSGNRIYMAFFKPGESNFWEGNVTKFGISASNVIVDANGQTATWPNGAMREDAVPYWQTKDWADPLKSNYIHNSYRNIYTYLGYSQDLTDSTNAFATGNSKLTSVVLGNPSLATADIISFVRGADVMDENADNDTTDNRAVITGDVLHSEPLVVQYAYADNTSTTMVYFGANDGMLHAVLDITDPNVDYVGDEVNYGTEAWAFIPPSQLHRLKDMIEGNGHQYFVDASPKAYFKDVDGDGFVDTADGDKIILVCGLRKGGTGYFALDVTVPAAPQLLWLIDSGFATHGVLELSSIFVNNGGEFEDGEAIRIFEGFLGAEPEIGAYVNGGLTGNFLGYKNATAGFELYQVIGDLNTADYLDWDEHGFSSIPFILGKIVSIINTDPDVIIPGLGESWSEPQFGIVKTSSGDTTGTPVFFIGGGFSADNTAGKAVYAIDVFTGDVVKTFQNAEFGLSGMDYSIASSVNVIDADGNGFVDKIYVGDLGGQLWRIGKFTDGSDQPLAFPECNENINEWTAHTLFVSDAAHQRKFYYPPSVALEKGYDLVSIGTGDRESACDPTTSDRFYSIKDAHQSATLVEEDLVNVTDAGDQWPDLDDATADVDLNGKVDQGWYLQFAAGEKVLAEHTVFYKTVYFTTFLPNDDLCLPGGVGNLYALEYKTGQAVLDFDDDGDNERSVSIGGGIPSKVVTVITDNGGVKLFISVGSTNPDPNSEAFDAGVVSVDPLAPENNFFYMWWRELLNL